MEFKSTLEAIDSHTMGEPTRIIVDGMPEILGETVAEKKQYLSEKLDYLRRALMLEPRGHRNMFGAIILDTNNLDADFGIVFMDAGGYLNMCGHASIGAMTVAVEAGLVEKKEPVTTIKMDTPAGLVEGEVRVEGSKTKEVSLVNIPSFSYKRNIELDVPGIGRIKLDISFGGSFFAIVHASELSLKVDLKNKDELIDCGLKIRKAINRTIEVEHPVLTHINKVDLVEIYDKTDNPKADYKNVVIFGKGQIDRSPCGTGTCAKLANMYSKGNISIGEEFVYESITGTLFKGRVMAETRVEGIDAVVPEITGQAFITGINKYVIDESDPLKYGVKI